MPATVLGASDHILRDRKTHTYRERERQREREREREREERKGERKRERMAWVTILLDTAPVT
jgi:hypothetical protein